MLKIFYRDAGPKDAPTVLLLHGFPTSSHQYRGLIERLAEKYRVIAPDLPGFGFSDAPEAQNFGYTFDHLAEVIEIRTRRILSRKLDILAKRFGKLHRRDCILEDLLASFLQLIL